MKRCSVLSVRGMNKNISLTFASQEAWEIIQAQTQSLLSAEM